jgi:phage terminase large subunit
MPDAITIDLSGLKARSNPAFYALHSDRHRRLVLMGGAGSGKSEFTASKFLKRILSEENQRFLFIRKVGKTIRHSQYQLFEDWVRRCDLMPLFTFARSELEIRCTNGNTITCMGLDDSEKLKSIAGITSIWIEEATELSSHDFAQVDLRLRAATDSYLQIVLSFNPISATHWLKKRFFDSVDPDARVHISTYRDNRWAGPEYARMLESLADTNPVLHGIYARAQWGVLKGLVYGPFLQPGTRPAQWHDRFCGLDFGYTNPTALIRCNQDADGAIHLEELLYETGLTNSDLIARLGEMRFPRDQIIWADCAAPDRIAELQAAGYICLPYLSHRVHDGIDFVKSLRVYSGPDNTNMNREAETYSWREDKAGNQMDEPVKFSDHAMDAMRYAIWSHLHPQPERGGVYVEDLSEQFASDLVPMRF